MYPSRVIDVFSYMSPWNKAEKNMSYFVAAGYRRACGIIQRPSDRSPFAATPQGKDHRGDYENLGMHAQTI
jgi:hypothetical protein